MASGKKKNKMRLDQLLVERGLVESRQKGQALIMCGLVIVNEQAVTKVGQPVEIESTIRIKGSDNPYVSRGGLKIEGALKHFEIDPSGFVCLDVGSSTGGFTDCLLQKGAVKVYALDVGTNQLAWKLRQDERVVCWEQKHIKELKPEEIVENIDLIVIDVSFISLTRVIPYLVPFLEKGAQMLAMVKPQFEVGKGEVGKGGVVREEEKQLAAVKNIAEFVQNEGFKVIDPCKAPIKGPSGNQEYFLLAGGKLDSVE